MGKISLGGRNIVLTTRSSPVERGGEREHDEPERQRAPQQALEARERVFARDLPGAERRARHHRAARAHGITEPNAEGAGAAREDDALLRTQPRRRLHAPAVQRVLEIANDGKRECAHSLRDPVENMEGARGEPAEIATLALRGPLPRASGAQRERIEDQADGARKQEEPEERAEGAVV